MQASDCATPGDSDLESQNRFITTQRHLTRTESEEKINFINLKSAHQFQIIGLL